MGYGGYVRGSSGGGGSVNNGSGSGSSAEQKEDKALELLNEITGKNRDAITNKFNQSSDMYGISDAQIRNLAANERKEAMTNSDDEWFDQQANFQTAVNNSKNSAGANMTGSNLLKFLDLVEDYDDKIDRDTRTTLRKNLNEINKNEFEQLAANVNARNESAIDTEYALKQLANDYLAQRVNINPEKAKGAAWDEWSSTGNDFYNTNKSGQATYTDQPLINEANAKAKANQLTNPAQANAAAGNINYFEDLLSSRKRRY